MLRLLSPLFRRIPCLLAAAGLLAACSPTLNWRDVDVGPQTRVQFPCRPEHAERSLVLAGAPMRAGMWVCDAGGLSWSVTVLDVSDPARLTTVLREARQREPWRTLGDERTLRRYARRRETPTRAMAGLTDGLLHLFADQRGPLKDLRNAGMTLVERLGPVKHWLVGRALDA